MLLLPKKNAVVTPPKPILSVTTFLWSVWLKQKIALFVWLVLFSFLFDFVVFSVFTAPYNLPHTHLEDGRIAESVAPLGYWMRRFFYGIGMMGSMALLSMTRWNAVIVQGQSTEMIASLLAFFSGCLCALLFAMLFCIAQPRLEIVLYGAMLGILQQILSFKNGDYILYFPVLQKKRWWRFKERLGILFSRCLRFSLLGIFPFLAIKFVLPISWSQMIFGIPREWLCSFFVLFNLQLVEMLVEIFRTEWIPFHQNGVECLPEAVNSQSILIRHLAFLDLYMVAQFDQKRRSTLLSEKIGETWESLLKSACSVIDGITIAYFKKKHPPNSSEKKSSSFLQKNPLTFIYNLIFPKKSSTPNPFSQPQLQIWAIRSITKFVQQSLKDDVVGVVQNSNSLPILLNSLIGALQAIEEDYQNSLPHAPFSSPLKQDVIPRTPLSPKFPGYSAVSTLNSISGSSVSKLDLLKSGNKLIACSDARAIYHELHTAIYALVITFYDNLSYYPFPPKYAHTLKKFVVFQH